MGKLYDESSNMYFKQNGKKTWMKFIFSLEGSLTNGEYWWKHKLRKMLRFECQIDPISNLDIKCEGS